MYKIIAFTRWIIVVFFIGIFGILTEWIMFHFAWFTRNTTILNKVFWVWMDDSRIGAEDYRVWLKGSEETWWLAYKWHLRNKVWNLNELFKVPPQFLSGTIITKYVINKLYMNNKKVNQGGYWPQFAGLKFIPTNEDDNIWQVNQGDVISKRTSILGTGYIWYKIGKWQSFRYSQCKIVDYGFWKGWRTIKLGTNNYRYVLTVKHQKIKDWK